VVDRAATQALADANLLAMFERIARHVREPRGEVRRFGRAVAVVTAVDTPLFNPILALDSAVTAADVLAAHAFATSRGVEPGLLLHTATVRKLSEDIEELGLERVDGEPALVLEPLRPVEVVTPPELILRALEPTHLEDWYAVTSWPADRRIFGPELASDPDVRLIVGYVHERPVTAAAAFGSPGVVGVYAVDTIDTARRRGYGRAATWAAIDAGRRAWRADLAVLQSTAAGLPLYRSMGFVEVGRYELYARP
jgi:hypothetical protein